MSISLSLQPLLRQPFARDIYRTILEDILPSGTLQLLQTPQPVIATCEFVTGTSQIGTIELPDGNTIALLEVHVADQIKLARNRVALRNFVARFIDEASTTAVLAVFHQPGKPDWRLTYACKRSQLDDDTLEIKSTQTAPRRYTFLLGENEPCKTAAGRLAELREKDEHLTLEEVEKAFSVERLNKDFFKDYKKHYETFTAHLLTPENAKATRTAFGIVTHKDKADQDKADKPIRDFVKRLLGRLVFLHFLQKKGWMGCKAGGKAWSGGDPDFLVSYFALAESKNDAHRFHSKWLIPLFFDALNNAERPGDLFPPTGTRIPYLNGGLFETDPAPLHALDFPVDHFSALLEFFGQYHFTIDENDPEDHEVGIDPEMLGHIFENLLEDNKDKGAYYTPKAIVSYMARQSLLHYLQTHLGENAELAVLLNEKDFTRLEKNGFVHQNAKRIADLLDAVKICDPAIGSGAFPIGVLQEILWTRLALNLELNTPEERAKLKRRIIQNSIHGVDLDPGAVEIARLRFWLALVVDEDQPRPLPNLDYKIHRADSLIEYIRGEPVHLGKVNAEDKRTHGAIQKLIEAKAQLFTAQKLPEKRAARFALYRALADVAMAEFTWLRNDMGLIADDAERAAQLDHGLKEFGHRMKLIDSAAKESTKIQDRILTDLRAWFDDDQKPTFLWQLHFGEVFEAGGFDIIIGNPPFRGGREWRSDTTVDFDLLENRYTVAQYQFDIYALFWELCVQLAKDKGSVTLVTPNTWLNNQSTRKLRAYLLSETSPRIIVDCTRTKIFENAVVLPIITQVSKNDVPKIVQIVEPTPAGFIEVKRIDPRYWNEDDQKIINISLATGHAEIRTKLEVNGSPLVKHATVKFGIKLYETGKGTPPQKATDAKNHIFESENKDSKDHRPYLEGKDVVRYTVGYKGRWLRYGSNLAAPRRAEYFEGPRLLFRRIVGERLIGTFTDQDYVTSQLLQIVIPHVAASAKWLLAQLNSSLIAFYFRSKYNRQDKTFPEIRVYELESLPVKTPPAHAAQKLEFLAEACAAAAQRGDEATLAVHEAEIDQIVYRLFDLTPDEIDLIESALAPTRTTKPAKRGKVVRTTRSAPEAILCAESPAMADAPKLLTPIEADSKPPHTECADHSPAAWLPGELFSVEGELPAAKKVKAAPEAASKADKSVRAPVQATSETAIPIDQIERDKVLAVIRDVFNSGAARDRETALREISQALGYGRIGSRIREILDRDLITAVRRGILQNEGGQLSLLCRSIEGYERSFLKEQFLAAINQNGRVWIERDEATRLFARWLGFRRTGKIIDESARSLINGLLREGSLEKDGQNWIRRA